MKSEKAGSRAAVFATKEGVDSCRQHSHGTHIVYFNSMCEKGRKVGT